MVLDGLKNSHSLNRTKQTALGETNRQGQMTYGAGHRTIIVKSQGPVWLVGGSLRVGSSRPVQPEGARDVNNPPKVAGFESTLPGWF